MFKLITRKQKLLDSKQESNKQTDRTQNNISNSEIIIFLTQPSHLLCDHNVFVSIKTTYLEIVDNIEGQYIAIIKGAINLSEKFSKSWKCCRFHPINKILIGDTFNRVDILGVSLVGILSGALTGVVVLVVCIGTRVEVGLAVRIAGRTWCRRTLNDPGLESDRLFEEVLVGLVGDVGGIQTVMI